MIAPWGQYDDTKIVNIGTNRWSFKPEIGISKAIGPWTFEATAAATFFTDNDDFFGGNVAAPGPALFGAGARDLRLSLGNLGFARCHVFHRRAHDPRRRAEQRPSAELARRGRPSRFRWTAQNSDQALRQQRRVVAHRQRLRPRRRRVAIPLGRRDLMARTSHAGAGSGRHLTHFLARFANHPRNQQIKGLATPSICRVCVQGQWPTGRVRAG